MSEYFKVKSILLSLGHNSSAIAVDEAHNIICGYEEERLTGIKSDSSFPINAIHRICELCHVDKPDFYISHWFSTGRLENNKWYDEEFMRTEFGGSKIYSLDSSYKGCRSQFSHHDAHAYSAVWFAGEEFCKRANKIIVADGFGTFDEVISVYSLVDGKPVIKLRCHDLTRSLGLFYQYTTSFLGMKENQDEYKLLGYEAHIADIASDIDTDLQGLDSIIADIAKKDANSWYKDSWGAFTVDVSNAANYTGLAMMKQITHRKLASFINKMETEYSYSLDDVRSRRVVVSRYAQLFVESCIAYLVCPEDTVLLAGGLFYNVKLNSMLADSCKEVCVMPLAGDQGAALGLYKMHNPSFRFPGHLNWGIRPKIEFTKEEKTLLCSWSMFVVKPSELAEMTSGVINNGKIVNVVRANMEFGPRALCNTTTFAEPTMENVEYINMVNGRSTIMPMAPVVKSDSVRDLMLGTEKVHMSLDFMVCARMARNIGGCPKGASHNYPASQNRSMRPQIVYPGSFAYRVLEMCGVDCLINTSYNVHGQPIIYDKTSLMLALKIHHDLDSDERIVTLIEGEE